MCTHQQLRTPARWRSAPVPEGFGTRPYSGQSGPVVLPLGLDWSPGGLERDLNNHEDRIEIYEIVLTVGAAADVEAYIDPRELVAVWDDLHLPGAVTETWSIWVAEHQKLRRYLLMQRTHQVALALMVVITFLAAACSDTTGTGTESTSRGSAQATTTETVVVPTTAPFRPSSFDPPSEPERPYSFVARPERLDQGEAVTLTFPEGSVFDGGRISCWRLRVWDSASGWRETLWAAGTPSDQIWLLTPEQAARRDCVDPRLFGPEDLVMPEDIIPAWYQVCEVGGGLCSNPFLVTAQTSS